MKFTKKIMHGLYFIFIRNKVWSVRTKIMNFLVKLLAVSLYLLRAYYDTQDPLADDYCNEDAQYSIFPGFSHPNSTENLNSTTKDYIALFKVCRSKPLWIFQVTLACCNFFYAVIIVILRSKGNIIRPLTRPSFWLEMITTLPFCVSLICHFIDKPTVFGIPYMQIWVPVFLNVWLADSSLSGILRANNDKENTALMNQIYDLAFTIFALLITCICGVSHFERCGARKDEFDLLNATWFVFVTLSTVGYGDVSPDTGYGKIVVIFVIICTVMILPGQLSVLNDTRAEAKAHGAAYSRSRAKREKHVVISTTELRYSVIVDFLHEFYMYPKLYNYFVVLLTPAELNGSLKRFLEIPIWQHRVIYIQGTVLDEDDLVRAKINFAEGCFVLTSRTASDKREEDEQTVLRAMSIKDFAPTCPLYVQLLLPQSKFHVKFAEQVICDEEFMYQLLALNCDLPGISTALVLLSHTASELEDLKTQTQDQWKLDVNKSIDSEIYDVEAGESKIYKAYVGESFTVAAYGGYLNSHTMLIGIKPKNMEKPRILLNPGTEVTIKKEDTLYYIGDTCESDLPKNRLSKLNEKKLKGEHGGIEAAKVGARRSVCLDNFDKLKSASKTEFKSVDYVTYPWARNCSKSFPPHVPHPSYHYSHMCYIVNEGKRGKNSGNLSKPNSPINSPIHSESSASSQPGDRYSHLKFENNEHQIRQTFNRIDPVIIICKQLNRNILNLIIPLRSANRKVEEINPIIIFTVLGDTPSSYILSAIACFPEVFYFNSGTLESVTDLIRVGVPTAKCVLLLKGEGTNQIVSVTGNSDHCRDQTQIIDYLNLELLFPEIRLILELTHLSNLRFLQFKHSRPLNSYPKVQREDILKQNRSKCGEHKREVFAVHTHMPYLFREAFCTGRAFSTSMLDTLLYQSFIKPYLPELVKILLGLRYSDGSGTLSGIRIGRSQHGKKFQELMENDKQFFGVIPFGIYREYRFEDKHNRSFSIIPTQSNRSIRRAISRNKKTADVLNLENGFSSEKVELINDRNDLSENRFASTTSQKHISDYKFNLASEIQDTDGEQLRKVLIEKASMLPTERVESLVSDKIEKLRSAESSLENSPSKNSSVATTLTRRKASKAGYVLLNPKPDKPVQQGDIIYVLLPAAIDNNLKFRMDEEVMMADVV